MENRKFELMKNFLFYTLLLLVLFLLCGKDSGKKNSGEIIIENTILDEQRQLKEDIGYLKREVEDLRLEIKRKEQGN